MARVTDAAASVFVQQEWTSYAVETNDVHTARVSVCDASGAIVREYTAPWERLTLVMRLSDCSFCGPVQVAVDATGCPQCGAFLAT